MASTDPIAQRRHQTRMNRAVRAADLAREGAPPEWDEEDARSEYIDRMLPDRTHDVARDYDASERLVQDLDRCGEARAAIIAMVCKHPEDRTREEHALVWDWMELAKCEARDQLERKTL